jgi:hypothetical protein
MSLGHTTRNYEKSLVNYLEEENVGSEQILEHFF